MKGADGIEKIEEAIEMLTEDSKKQRSRIIQSSLQSLAMVLTTERG